VATRYVVEEGTIAPPWSALLGDQAGETLNLYAVAIRSGIAAPRWSPEARRCFSFRIPRTRLPSAVPCVDALFPTRRPP